MTVGPERVYALSVEAQAHAAYAKAVAAGVLAQAVPGKFDWSYDYDENGNLEATTKSDSTGTVVQADGYTYDGENRLATHSLGGALDVTYAYDADGIRTGSKKAGADPTYFLTDKNRPYAQVIEERTWLDPADPDNPDPEDALLAVRYTYGDDLIAQDRVVDPAANPTATTRSYYHYDGQLSTRMLTDAQADPDTPSTAPPTVTDTYTYDAFGNLLDSATDDGTPTVNNCRYTGEQYDPNLGFYYLRARYYDEAVGRFTTRDTFAGSTFEPASLHKYLYAHADPVMLVDPSGQGVISYVQQLVVTGILAFLRYTLDLGARVAPGAYVALVRLNFIALRAFQLIPTILNGLLIATVVLDVGFQMIDQLTANTTPIRESTTGPLGPGEVAAVDRGRMIEEIAGANIRGNVKGVDDFRQGVATQIKSYGAEDSSKLLTNIARDLRAFKEKTSTEIKGRAYDGRSVLIRPGQIQARQLIVALEEDTQVWRDSGFLQRLRSLSEEYKIAIRPTIVRLWTIRRR